MKYALLAASLAALTAGFTCASAQVSERREVAPPGQTSSGGQGGLHTPLTPHKPETAVPSAQAPETIGRALDELSSAAEARRVRAAVARTLDRTRELSRGGLE